MIRADPDRQGLLYAGTESGVYVSFDDGDHWQSLQLELPIVPITDLAVKQKDLVAATQGRGYWILDDLSPLHQMAAEQADAAAHLYRPRSAYRVAGGRGFGTPRNAGKNPPSGAIVYYTLAEEPDQETELELEVLDRDGEVIRTYTRKPKPGEDSDDKGSDDGEDLALLPADKGLNRFAWDLSYSPAEKFPGLVIWNRRMGGPRAIPGSYSVRLTLGEWSAEESFEVLADPRVSASPEDFEAQFRFHKEVRDKLTEMHKEIGRVRDVRSQLEDLEKRLEDREGTEEIVAAIDELNEKMKGAEEALYQTQNRSRQDPLNFPIRLNDKLAGLLGLASFGDNRPTEQMYAARAELQAAIDAELAKLTAIWEEDLPAFNLRVRESDVEAVILGE